MKNPLRLIKKRTSISDPWHWLTRIVPWGVASGVTVNADNALKVSAVLACIKVISESIASLPLMLYERAGEGKQPAVNHPLFSILHDKPNDYQTSFEWRECLVTHLNLRGNAYCQKIENGRGLKSLIPLNPANMEVLVDNEQLVYRYTHEDGMTEEFPAEKIWHLKNMPISSGYNASAPEGILGISPITMAREAIGISLAADEYGGRYFSNNSTVGLALKHPGKLSENAKNFLRESLAEYGKLENKFKSLILEEGMAIDTLGISNEDSQFLESRQFQIEEIARIFRVPPILIGHPTNTMTYASAEQLFLSFGKFTILPWCRRIEQSMNAFILRDQDRGRYFFEFNIDGLLRADILTRYRAYAIARQWGFKNVDEIRALENDNPLPDGKGQIYLEPMNMTEAGAEENINQEEQNAGTNQE